MWNSFPALEIQYHFTSPQAWHAWAVMNFEAVLHYKHQNQGRDEKKKLRHASGASANSEASNSDSEVDSTDHSPVPSPGQKKVNEVRVDGVKPPSHLSKIRNSVFSPALLVWPIYIKKKIVLNKTFS